MDKEKEREQEDQETDYTGYSEQQTDLDIESGIREFKSYKQVKKQSRVAGNGSAGQQTKNKSGTIFQKINIYSKHGRLKKKRT